MANISVGLRVNYDGASVTAGVAQNRADLQSLAQAAQAGAGASASSAQALAQAEAQMAERIREATAAALAQAAAQNSLTPNTAGAAAAATALAAAEAQAAAGVRAAAAAALQQSSAQNALSQAMAGGAGHANLLNASIRATATAALAQSSAQNALSQAMAGGAGHANLLGASIGQVAAGSRAAADALQHQSNAQRALTAGTTDASSAINAGIGALRNYRAEIARLNTEFERSGARLQNIRGDLNALPPGVNRLGAAGESAGRQVNAGMSAAAGGGARLLEMLKLLGAGFALSAVVGGLVKTADAMTNLESRLKLVTTGHNDLHTAQAAVFQIAQSTRSSLAATGDIYYKMSKGAQELGMSQAQVARLTETIGQAMTLSGSSAESAQAALIQFGQALSSGVLRGEELNSVMEQAPALAEAIAKGMGKSVGELRMLGETGQLTVQQIMGALEKSAPEVARQFATMAPTISGSYQMLSNASMQFIGQLDKQTGASHTLASSIQFISGNLQAFTAVAAVTASVGLGGLIGKQALAIQSSIARAAALGVEAAATRAQIVADLAHARALEGAAVARLAEASAERAQLAAMSVYGPARARVEREIALATAQRTQAQLTATAAEGRLAAATVGSSAAMTGARAVMGALGGPIGAVTALLLAGAAAWSMFGESAEDAGQKSAAAVAKVQSDALERGRDQKQANLDFIADRQRVYAIASAEYRAAPSPSAKSDVWKKYGMGRLSEEISAAEAEIKKIEEREKNLAAKIAGAATSDNWQKAYLSPERKKEHDLSALDALYAKEAAKFIGNQEKQLQLAAEYAEKRATILSKKEHNKTDSYAAARLERQKAEYEQSAKIDDAYAKIALADLEGRHKAQIISDESFYAQRREAQLKALHADQAALLKEMQAQSNDFARQNDPVKKEQSLTRLIKLGTQYQEKAVQISGVGIQDESDRIIKENAVAAARLERQKAEYEQSAKIDDAYAKVALADLEGRHRAQLVSDENFYAQKREAQLKALHADQAALLKEMQAQSDDFASQNDPVKKEQSLTRLIKLGTQYQEKAVQISGVGIQDESDRIIKENAVAAARLERQKAEYEQSAKIDDAYAKVALADLEGRHRAQLVSDENFYAQKREAQLKALHADQAALLKEMQAQSDDFARQNDPVKKEQSLTRLIKLGTQYQEKAVQISGVGIQDESDRIIKENAVAAARLERQKAEYEQSKKLADDDAKLEMADLEGRHKAQLISDDAFYDQKRANQLKALHADQAALLKEMQAQSDDFASQNDPVKKEQSLTKLIKLGTQYQEIAKNIARTEKDGTEWIVKLNADIAEMQQELDGATQSMSAYVSGLDFANKERAIEIQALSLAEPKRAAFLQQKKEELALEKMLSDLRLRGISPSDSDISGYKDRLRESQTNEAILIAAKKTDAEWTKTVEKIDNTFHDGFAASLSKNEKSWDAFTTNLNHTFQVSVVDEIYKSLAKPFAVKLVANVAGMTGMSVPGAPGAMGMLGNASNLYGFTGPGGYASQGGAWLDSVMGTTGSASQGAMLAAQTAGFEGSQAAMLYAQTADFGAAGAALTESAMGAGTGMAEGFLAGIGPLGWAAIAGTLVMGSGVLDHKGGPKLGGFATTSTNGVADFERTYTPNTADADIAKVVAITQSGYAATAARFGATGSAKFSFGADSDPLGTADNRYTYAGSVGGKSFSALDVGDGRGDIGGTISKGVRAMMLDALQHTDFGDTLKGKLAAAIVAGLEPATITTQMSTKVDAALAGAADLFGGSAFQAKIGAANTAFATLTENFTKAGASGQVSAAGLKAAASALDTTSAAGQESARNMLSMVQDVRAYEEQLLGLIGYTRQSLEQDLFQTIQNSPDAATAGETLAEHVVGGIRNTMLGDLDSQIIGIITSGIVQPALTAMAAGNFASEVLSQAHIDEITRQATALSDNFTKIWTNPEFQAALDKIKISVAGVTKAGLAGLPSTSGVFFDSSKQAVKDQQTAADKAQRDAEKAASDEATRIKNLRDFMETVGDAAATLNLGGLAKGFYDAAKAMRDQIQKAQDLGASEAELAAVRALEAAKIKKLIDDGLTGAYSARLSLTDPLAGSAYSVTLAQQERDKAFANPLNVGGAVTPGNIEEFARTNWTALDEKQQAGLIDAYGAQTKYLSSLKGMFDAQLAKVNQVQGWITQVQDFSKSIDQSKFDIQYALPGADQKGMLQAKESGLWKDFYSASDGTTTNDDTVQRQIKLAGDLKDVILQRYQLETANATKMLDFSRNIGDYLKNLRLGELSPLTNAQKMAEAKSQYEGVINTINDATASDAAKELARGKLQASADAYLKTGRDYYASSADYTAMYQQVTGTLEQMGADTGTDAERQLKVTQSLVDKAGLTIKELDDLKGVADTGLGALKTMLQPELGKLGDIATLLGSNGAIALAISGLPNGLRDIFLDKNVGGNWISSGGASTTINAANPYDSVITGKSGHVFTAGVASGWVSQQVNAGNLMDVYNAAKAEGISSKSAEALMKWPAGSVNQWAVAQGLPQFRSGGTASSGYYIAHEGELIEGMGATRIYPAEQTSHILDRLDGGQDNTALIAKMQVLIEMVEELIAENARLAGMVVGEHGRNTENSALMVVDAIKSSAQSRKPRAGMAKL